MQSSSSSMDSKVKVNEEKEVMASVPIPILGIDRRCVEINEKGEYVLAFSRRVLDRCLFPEPDNAITIIDRRPLRLAYVRADPSQSDVEEYRLDYVPYDEDGYDDADYSSTDEDEEMMYQYMANFTRLNFEFYGKKMPPDHLNPFFMD